MQSRNRIFWLWLAAVLWLAACSPGSSTPTPTQTAAATRSGDLTAYIPQRPTATPQPSDLSSPTPLPSPTPTPRKHIVKQGDDLFGISLFYGVPLEEIIAANPTVNPRAMSIGTELIIPPALTPQPTDASQPANIQQTPTPLPVETGPLRCTPAQDGGIWCFQLVRNPNERPLESLTGIFRLSNSSGIIFSQTAFLPLDTLPPGSALPLSSYFAPVVAANLGRDFRAGGEVISALPNPDDGRYINSRVENQKVMISASGLSAVVTFDVLLDQQEAVAGRVWAAATAYDSGGNVVGVRRWGKQGKNLLKSGQALPVEMHIYSVSGPISRVEVISEARP